MRPRMRGRNRLTWPMVGRLQLQVASTSMPRRCMERLGAVAFDASVKHDIRSITKSVTSLLFGIARAQGWVCELDTPVIDYFPEHAGLRTQGWERVTLAHLLTMSAGLDWNERLAWDDPANNE